MKNLKIFFLLIFALMQLSANAAGIKVTASVDRSQVAVGGQFQLIYSIDNADVNDIKLPTMTGVKIVGGPSQSTSINGINGRFTQTLSLIYIVQAVKEGKFTIPSATILTRQGNLESNPVVIEVVRALPQSNSNKSNQQSDNLNEEIKKHVFLKVVVDKTNVYQGEQITVSYKLYQSTAILESRIENEKPSVLRDFWAEDYTLAPQSVRTTREQSNGIQFNVIEIKRVALFAQHGGTLIIDPFELKLDLAVNVSSRSSTIWGNLFSQSKEMEIELQSNSIAINVKPLPANKPDGFSGAVGKFRMDASADKTSLTTDDAITYKITISGTGNLRQFDNPKLNTPSDFEVYDPKISENIPKDANPISGSKTYEYLIIPRVSGNYTIPAVDFSYFDLDKKDYVTLHSNEFAVNVKQGKNQNNATLNGVKKEDLKLLGQDIRYIKTNDVKFEKGNGGKFFGTMLFWWLSLLPIILSAAVLIYVKTQKTLMGDKSAMAFKQASRLARKRLQVAEKLLKQKNEKGFYDEVMRSLHGYVSNKMKIRTADLSKENIVASFQQKNIGDETSAKFIHVLDDCEMALYAPSAVQGGMEQVYKNATELIVDLESKII